MIYQLVQGDQAPQIQAVLKRSDDGTVIDFSGGNCALKFRAKGTTTILFTLAAADVGGNFEAGIAVFSHPFIPILADQTKIALPFFYSLR